MLKEFLETLRNAHLTLIGLIAVALVVAISPRNAERYQEALSEINTIRYKLDFSAFPAFAVNRIQYDWQSLTAAVRKSINNQPDSPKPTDDFDFNTPILVWWPTVKKDGSGPSPSSLQSFSDFFSETTHVSTFFFQYQPAVIQGRSSIFSSEPLPGGQPQSTELPIPDIRELLLHSATKCLNEVTQSPISCVDIPQTTRISKMYLEIPNFNQILIRPKASGSTVTSVHEDRPIDWASEIAVAQYPTWIDNQPPN